MWLDKTSREEIIFNIISLVRLWRVSGYYLLSTGFGAHPSKLHKPTSKIEQRLQDKFIFNLIHYLFSIIKVTLLF